MNKIDSRVDWLLESCYTHCFVCGEIFNEPPRLDRYGKLDGRALVLDIVVDETGFKEETDERICNKCWKTDLSQFSISTKLLTKTN